MNVVNTPQVSIITPAYNAVRFLARLVNCVQEQQGVLYEHIIVNDGSNDGTAEHLEALAAADPRIRVINCPKNVGVVVARNLAITAARGRFLAFLDADDVWLPEKLQCQTDFMLRTGAAISFTDYRFMTEDGTKIGPRLRGPRRIGWHFHHMTRFIGCLTVMVDREQCPDFCFPLLPKGCLGEDFLAWSAVIRKHCYAYRYPRDLARYSIVANSLSRGQYRAGRSIWHIYRKVEKLSFVSSLFYFCFYAVFALIKRRFLSPMKEGGNFYFDCKF